MFYTVATEIPNECVAREIHYYAEENLNIKLCVQLLFEMIVGHVRLLIYWDRNRPVTDSGSDHGQLSATINSSQESKVSGRNRRRRKLYGIGIRREEIIEVNKQQVPWNVCAWKTIARESARESKRVRSECARFTIYFDK